MCPDPEDEELSVECHFGQNSRFYYEWSTRIVKDWDFIIYDWDMLWKVETLWWSVEICHSRSRFCYETVKISWWQVEILLWVVNVFMMTAARDFVMNTRDFHDDSSRFLWKKVEILLWTVEILRMTGQYFHNDRSRFLWQVKTLLHVEIFMKTVRDLHDDVLMLWLNMWAWGKNQKNFVIIRTFIIITDNHESPFMNAINILFRFYVTEHQHNRCIRKLKCYKSLK